MAPLQLTLLGGFQARIDTGPALALPTKKAQALLAYLALPAGRAHPRDKLATLLWGDSPEGAARTSLRQALFALRRALPEGGVRADGEAVALEPATVEVDVAAFERGIAAGTPAALQGAVSLYRGDLLAGLSVDGAAGFEEWLPGERERLRELALEGLAKLLAHQRQSGQVEVAIQTGLQLLGLDPLEEPVHRTLMRLYAEAGRRAAALRQYQACVAVLGRELGVEPEAETKQLYEEILRRRVEAPSRRPRPEPESTTSDTPLIGRDVELATLRAALAEAGSGRGRIVVVLGEAGVGKSRLLTEIATDAGRAGSRILLGRAYESAQILPFGPWVDAFRTGGLTAEARIVGGLTAVWRAELARLFPDLAMPGLPAPSEDYLRLFESISHLVGHVAATQPLVLLLEDLHWADEMSLRLLSFVGRRLQAWPVLVVATAREEELADAATLRRSLGELRSDGRLAELTLVPLSRSDTASLVRCLSATGRGSRPMARLEEQVWATSEGNPFVVVETVRALREGLTLEESSKLSLPRRVREVIAARVERLSDQGRALLSAAAVIGREFDFALLQRVSGLGDREAAGGVEELVRRRMLHGVGEGFDVTHDRIREAVYAGLLEPRRRALHAAVGHVLEALQAATAETLSDRLAYHFEAAGIPDKAVHHLAEFARTARQRYTFDEAERATDHALTLVDRMAPPERERTRLDLVVLKAWLLTGLGRFRDTLTLLLSYRQHVEALDSPTLVAQYCFRLAFAHMYVGEAEATRAAVARGLAAANHAGDEAAVGLLHYVLGLLGFSLGQPEEGIHHCAEAIARLTRSTQRFWLGLAHTFRAGNHYLRGDFDAAFPDLDVADGIGKETNEYRLQSNAAWCRGMILAARGDAEAALTAARHGRAVARDVVADSLAVGYMGSILLEVGEPADAVAMLEAWAAELQRFCTGHAATRFTAALAEAHLALGNVDRAGACAERAVAIERESPSAWSRGVTRRAQGRVALARGDLAAADTTLEEAMTTLASVGLPHEVGRLHLLRAEVALARGDRPAALARFAEGRRILLALDLAAERQRLDLTASRLGLDS